MTIHARLSPSSAHRWLKCPIAPSLEALEPEGSSEAADEGTEAHAWCERKLREYLQNGEYLCKVADNAEMEEATTAYADYVIALYENAIRTGTPDARLLIEQCLDIRGFVPDCFGYADAVIVANDTLHVIDFKYGAGIRVDAGKRAGDNPQLSLYAAGAWDTLNIWWDEENHRIHWYLFDTIQIHIFQPRMDNIATTRFSVAELADWLENTVKPAALKADRGEGEAVPGEHCQWCRVKGKCRKRAEYMQEAAKQRERKAAATLSVAEIAEILPTLDPIKKWCNEVHEYALQQALHGVPVPGYHLAHGRPTRKITDPERLCSALSAAGYGPDTIYKPQEMKALTTLEKLTGPAKFAELSQGCIERTEGKMTLMPDTKQAAKDFDIQEEK